MARRISVQIVGDSRSLERAFGRSGRAARGFGVDIGRQVRIASTAAAAGLAGIGAIALKSAGDFEQSLDIFQAVSKATADQMRAASTRAKALGADLSLPATSAKDAAEAMTELAKGGLTVAQTLAATKGVLQLSAAAQIGNAEAATIAARALKAFGLGGNQAVRVADILANAANKSTGEITDFALGLQQAAAVARQTGLSINETVAALMQLADAGVVGSDAGTSLRTMLQRLTPTSAKQAKEMRRLGIDVFDASGNFVGIRTAIERYQKALSPLTDEQRKASLQILFGSDAIRAANIVLGSGAKAFDEYIGKTRQAGAAADLAAAKTKGFRGSLEGLKSAGETLAISLGSVLLPVATDVVRGLAGAVNEIDRFVSEVAAERTIQGKLNVVWEGVQGAAEGATEAIGRAVRAIDWPAVWAKARGIADGLQARLEQVDWGVIGEEIGDAFVGAVRVAVPAAKELAERVNKAVGAIDFEDLGKKLGPGLAAALVTAFTTLLDPAFWVRNWDLSLAVAATVFRARIATFAGKLIAPLARVGSTIVLSITGAIERAAPQIANVLLNALLVLPRVTARALSPITGVVTRVFARLGRLARFIVTVLGIQAVINAVVGLAKRVGAVFSNLGRSISGALDRAWEQIKRSAIRAALAIVEPFSRLPAAFGGWARDAKDALKRQLDEMGQNAEATATRIQSAIDGVEGRRVVIAIDTIVNAPGGPRRPEEGTRGPGRALGESVDRAAASAVRAAASEAAATGAKVADAQSVAAAQIAAAKAKAAQAAKRAAAAAQRALEQQREAFARLFDNLGLASERAAATKGLRDDLRVANQMLAAIDAQIKVEGRTAELLRQQLDAEQRIADLRKQIAENRRAAQAARQFRALGLSDTGGERIPTAGTLGKRLAALKDQVKGSFLDTTKTRAQLQQIAKVLRGAFGKVGADVRSAIKQMLDDIAGALREGDGGVQRASGEITRGGIRSTQKLVKGLGLSAEQVRELQRRNLGVSRMSRTNAFGFAMGGMRPASVGAVGTGGINITGPITVVASDPDDFMRELQKRAGRRAASRRGRHGGRNLGLG